MNINYMN